jgi:pimeloyl-ACP methyl ester carboxylesterase
MRVRVGDVRLFFDMEGPSLVVEGPAMRERPTLLLLSGGPGFDHTVFKPAYSRLAEVAQVIYLDFRGHGRTCFRGARWCWRNQGSIAHQCSLANRECLIRRREVAIRAGFPVRPAPWVEPARSPSHRR